MWNERYSQNPYYYGRMPNDFLVSSISYIPKGKVLCLAEGEGRNSVFLARSGYQVTGVDFSETAVENARKWAESNRVSVEYLCEDLETYDLGDAQWDGIVSIFCHFPSEIRRGLHKRIAKALKKGGVFVMETYSPGQLSFGTGGPKNTDFLLGLDEVKTEFPGFEFQVAQEVERVIMEGIGHTGPSAVTQVIATKL